MALASATLKLNVISSDIFDNEYLFESDEDSD